MVLASQIIWRAPLAFLTSISVYCCSIVFSLTAYREDLVSIIKSCRTMVLKAVCIYCTLLFYNNASQIQNIGKCRSLGNLSDSAANVLSTG